MLNANNALLLVLILISAFWDFKERKIPNKITFTGILTGILFNLITNGWVGLLEGILGLLVGLAVFFYPSRWVGWEQEM